MANLQSFIDAYSPALINISVAVILGAILVGIVKIFITLAKSRRKFF